MYLGTRWITQRLSYSLFSKCTETETYDPLDGYTFSSFSIILFFYISHIIRFPLLSFYFSLNKTVLTYRIWFVSKRFDSIVNKPFPIGFVFFFFFSKLNRTFLDMGIIRCKYRKGRSWTWHNFFFSFLFYFSFLSLRE